MTRRSVSTVRSPGARETAAPPPLSALTASRACWRVPPLFARLAEQGIPFLGVLDPRERHVRAEVHIL